MLIFFCSTHCDSKYNTKINKNQIDFGKFYTKIKFKLKQSCDMYIYMWLTVNLLPVFLGIMITGDP